MCEGGHHSNGMGRRRVEETVDAPAQRMIIRVLGPLQVQDEQGRAVTLPGRERRLLTALLISNGRMVPADQLIDAIWGMDPPAQARTVLHNVVSRLRRSLGDAAVILYPAGYGLSVKRVSTDLEQAKDLLAMAAAADPDLAVDLYDRALALWRGPAYADGGEVARGLAHQLAELRLRAREDRADSLLSAGRALDAAAAMTELAADEPLRERAVLLLMEAHYRDRRIPEALATFQRYRDNLAEELGLDPGIAVTNLQGRILRDDLPERSNRGRNTAAGNADPPVMPSQARAQKVVDGNSPVATAEPLPFTAGPASGSVLGRDSDAAAVKELLARSPLVTLVGPGGVGKTTLARFVDGRRHAGVVGGPLIDQGRRRCDGGHRSRDRAGGQAGHGSRSGRRGPAGHRAWRPCAGQLRAGHRRRGSRGPGVPGGGTANTDYGYQPGAAGPAC